MSETSPGERLQLSVQFDRKERSAANWEAMNHGPLLKRPIVFFPAAVVIGLGLSWVVKFLPQSAVAGSLAGNLAVLLFSGAIVFASIKSQGQVRERAERRAGQPDVYTLDAGGLEISSVDDVALMSWSGMTRVLETGRFFLFVAGSEIRYLPKRALSHAQLDVVRGLIARHGPGAQPSLPGPGPAS